MLQASDTSGRSCVWSITSPNFGVWQQFSLSAFKKKSELSANNKWDKVGQCLPILIPLIKPDNIPF